MESSHHMISNRIINEMQKMYKSGLIYFCWPLNIVYNAILIMNCSQSHIPFITLYYLKLLFPFIVFTSRFRYLLRTNTMLIFFQSNRYQINVQLITDFIFYDHPVNMLYKVQPQTESNKYNTTKTLNLKKSYKTNYFRH